MRVDKSYTKVKFKKQRKVMNLILVRRRKGEMQEETTHK